MIFFKDGIAEGITKIVGRQITNTMLKTTDNSDFKSVDQYQSHQFFTAITEGAERLESTNIWRQFANISRKIFDWKETVVTNVERMAAMAVKSLDYDMRVHIKLCKVVIIANTEWAAQKTWGTDISIAHFDHH